MPPAPVSAVGESVRPPASQDEFERRYLAGERLGEGGMGEVRLYTDRRIGRAVAMKVLLPAAATTPLAD